MVDGDWRALRNRRLWTAAGAVVLVLLGIVVGVWISSRESEPRAREYRDVSACLLTDEDGIASESAEPVWTGMQLASESSLVKVQYLEVNGSKTIDNARSYLGSLVLSGCELVVAVGQAQIGAVAADAAAYPEVQFIVVGVAASGANVSQVDANSPESTAEEVSQIVVDTLGG